MKDPNYRCPQCGGVYPQYSLWYFIENGLHCTKCAMELFESYEVCIGDGDDYDFDSEYLKV